MQYQVNNNCDKNHDNKTVTHETDDIKLITLILNLYRTTFIDRLFVLENTTLVFDI